MIRNRVRVLVRVEALGGAGPDAAARGSSSNAMPSSGIFASGLSAIRRRQTVAPIHGPRCGMGAAVSDRQIGCDWRAPDPKVEFSSRDASCWPLKHPPSANRLIRDPSSRGWKPVSVAGSVTGRMVCP